MQAFSPDWVSKALLDFRAKMEERLCRKLGEAKGPIVISALLFFSCTIYVIFDLRGTFFTSTPVHRLFDGYPLVIALTVFGYLAMRAAGRQESTSFVVGTGILTWFAFAWFTEQPGSLAIVFAVLLFSRAFLYATFFFMGGYAAIWRVTACLLGAVGLFNLFNFLGGGWAEFSPLYDVRPQRFLFLLLLPLLELQLLPALPTRGLFLRQLSFPPQLFYPLPTRLKHWLPTQDRWLMQLRGMVDILVGLLFLYIFNRMSKASFDKYDFTSVGEFFRFGLHCYLETYVLSCGSISIPVGLARLWGFPMPDAYSLPLLAASPFERWRRWNSYFYNFFRWAVFLPAAKKTGSLFVAVMLTFLVSSFFHVTAASPFNFIAIGGKYIVGDVLAFFLAHGLVVYVGLKWELRIFQGAHRIGWVGVGITWLLMIAVHTLNRWSS